MPLPRSFPSSGNKPAPQEPQGDSFALPSISDSALGGGLGGGIDFGLPPDESAPLPSFSDTPAPSVSSYEPIVPVSPPAPSRMVPQPEAVQPSRMVEQRVDYRTAEDVIPKSFAKELNKEVEKFYSVSGKELHPYDSTDSKGKKVKVKVSNFDKRKNLRTRYKIATSCVILAALALVGFGVKQTFFPSNAYSDEKVSALIAEKTGSYGFPVNSGRGFVQDFMKAYLSLGGANYKDFQSALGYFYTGENRATNAREFVTVNGAYGQEILIGPSIYSVREISANAANYTVGALVKGQQQDVAAPADGASAQWVFFSVNVYYDSEKESFAIAPNSPTITKPVTVQSDVPQMEKIGSGEVDKDLIPELQTSVTGFLEAYAKASPSDPSAVKPFVVNDDKVLRSIGGLGGTFELDEQTVQITPYTPKEGETEVKAEVVVFWKSTQVTSTGSSTSTSTDSASSAGVSYKSFYVFTFAKQSDGGYKITNFKPEVYLPSAETQAEESTQE